MSTIDVVLGVGFLLALIVLVLPSLLHMLTHGPELGQFDMHRDHDCYECDDRDECMGGRQ